MRIPIVAALAFVVAAPGGARADDTRLATTADGTTPVGGQAQGFSADGRFVLFSSGANDLVPDDTNGQWDLFVRDLDLGTVDRVNVADDGSEEPGGLDFYNAYLNISADGRFVAFVSSWIHDPAGHDGFDVYLRDRLEKRTLLVSHSYDGVSRVGYCYNPRVTRDGSHVLFFSQEDDLVAGDTNGKEDTFEWERATGEIRRVSIAADGGEFDDDCGNFACASADGRFVTFEEYEFDFSVKIEYSQAWLKDMTTGALERVDADETNAYFPNEAYVSDVSPDGRFVLVMCEEPLVAGDTNGAWDGFVRDLELGTLERVTLGTGRRELAGPQSSITFSEDARRVAFTSADDASGDDGNGVRDAFVFDRDTSVALRASLGSHDEESLHDRWGAGTSSDGRSVLFTGEGNVFVRRISDVPAASANYGAGFPGRFGAPSLTLDAPPRRNSTPTLQVGNSSGLFAVSVLFVGLASASLPTSLGGTFLVDPFTSAALALPPSGGNFSLTVPSGGDLPGLHLYLQALELDPWAAKGVSFTAGLDATIGD